MIQSKLAALLLATATLGAGSVLFTPSTARAQADVEVSFEFFNDALSPYGEWIEVGDYGLCWRPSNVSDNWAPYTDGYWSYTDAGWTWVSYEDFGGVTYHYGRWTNVEDEGWCWVPDYEWGPAWVSWRNSAEHVGWAPLPPEARWEPSVGFSVWTDNSYDIGPSYYNFCAVEDFGAPVLTEVILPRPRNVVIIQNTVNITNITVNNFIGVPFCGGPRYDVIIGRTRRPIPALKLVRETNINNYYNNTVINKTVIKNGGGRGRGLRAVQQGNQLLVPAPKVKRVANPLVAMPNLKPARSVPASKVRKGWNLVQDPEQREKIKQKMARDAKGLRPETAPARAIETAELQPVPEKADPNAPSPALTGRRDKRNGKNGNNGRDAAAEVAPGESTPGAEAPELAGGKRDRNDRDDRPGKTKKADRDEQPMTPAVESEPQTAEVDADKPGKQGREKNRKDRGENAAGIAAGEASPMKPFNGNKEGKKDKTDTAPDEATAANDADQQARKEKRRKDEEQIARATELQEEFRKRRKEQGQADRSEKEQNEKMGNAGQKERAERQREKAKAAAEQARQEQQARAAEREATRAERQREAQAENSARRQQDEAMERRQQMKAEAQQQRRQQAAEAQRQQMQAIQRQAARQQQAEAQQQQRAQALRQQQRQAQQAMQNQRAEQMQRQMQRQQQMPRQQQFQAPQQQQFRQGGGGGGGKGEGRGRRGDKEKQD